MIEFPRIGVELHYFARRENTVIKTNFAYLTIPKIASPSGVCANNKIIG